MPADTPRTGIELPDAAVQRAIDFAFHHRGYQTEAYNRGLLTAALSLDGAVERVARLLPEDVELVERADSNGRSTTFRRTVPAPVAAALFITALLTSEPEDRRAELVTFAESGTLKE